MTQKEIDQPTNGEVIEKRLHRWINSVSTVTLPLLAGFSVTSVVVVSDDAGKFRWPGPTVFALSAAALVLIVAVQCAYHAHVYLSKEDPEYNKGLAWAKRTRLFYDIGLFAVLVGLALVVVPRGATNSEADLQWAAAALAAVTSAVEIGWLVLDPWLRSKRRVWWR